MATKSTGVSSTSSEVEQGSAKGKTRMEEVYRKAARLFREKGYLRTSMNDIARDLNIQKGSLYYYIDDKETLLFEILERITESLIRGVRSLDLDHLTSREKLDSLIHEHFSNVLQHQDELPLLIYEVKNLRSKNRDKIITKRKEYEEVFLEVIREGIADGTFLGHNQHVVAFFILGGVFWFSQWFTPEDMEAQNVTESSFLKLFFNGLLSERTVELTAENDRLVLGRTDK